MIYTIENINKSNIDRDDKIFVISIMDNKYAISVHKWSFVADNKDTYTTAIKLGILNMFITEIEEAEIICKALNLNIYSDNQHYFIAGIK